MPGAQRDNADVDTPNTAGKDSAREMTLMYHFVSNKERRVAFVMGAGLQFLQIDYEGDSKTLAALRVEPGIAIKASEHFRMEVVYAFATGEAFDAWWLESTLLLRPVYVTDSGFSVHAQLGHTETDILGWRSKDFPERSGVTVGVGVGFEFR